MATARTDERVQDQIKSMMAEGRSIRMIARCLKVSRKTVRRFAEAKAAAAKAIPAAPERAWTLSVDWERVAAEAARGVPVKQLGREWAPDVEYLRFWRELRLRKPAKAAEPTMRLSHEPGEKAFADFCDGLPVCDPATGAKRKTRLFCISMPFSSYTHAEFSWDEKKPTFIALLERAWVAFGGVAPYLVIDNLKSGVTKSDLYDPVVNAGFVEYANHAGFAVLPARPRRPRDKAAVESGIGVVQRGFFPTQRDRRHFALESLNAELRPWLAKLNAEPMKDHGGASRLERFATERGKLKALPKEPWAPSEWRRAKVHPDCHVQADKCFYSVPHRYVGREVRVRLSERMVEIFELATSESIAIHARLKSRGGTSTQESHYPEAKAAHARFDVRAAKAQAERAGPETKRLIDHLLDREHPLKYLRRTQGILRLLSSGRVSAASLEHASKMAMAFDRTQLAYVTQCALHRESGGGRPAMAPPPRDLSDVYLHQSDLPNAGAEARQKGSDNDA